MIRHAEVAGEPHALKVVVNNDGEAAVPSPKPLSFGFVVAVSAIAAQQTSEESGEIADPLHDMLVLTARQFRDRELARAGR